MRGITAPTIRSLLREAVPDPRERAVAVRIAEEFLHRTPPDDISELGEIAAHHQRLRQAGDGTDPGTFEEALLTYYAALHMHEAPYTTAERAVMDRTGGYWAHAGGLSPILRAGPWIRPDSISCDLGAGNGLQGLLLQLCHPHRRCVQVELSSAMVAIGRRLQQWLGIAADAVEWIQGDVREVDLGAADFLYLYRPMRPETGAGRAFYSRLADTIATSTRRPVVFSIADPLRRFINPERVEVISSDGHLTILRAR
jgi:hypothetical protein